jgi:uncharacterized protein
MNVVLDTNVLLSGLMLPNNIPGKIVRSWYTARYDIVLCEPLLDEIRRSLAYPKIRKRLRWDTSDIDRFVMLLRFKAVIINIKGVKAKVPADSSDEIVLATLIASGAECLVSGDKDLLALRDEYPILSPAEFAQMLS